MTSAFLAYCAAVVIGVNIIVTGFHAGLSAAAAHFFREESRMSMVDHLAGGEMRGAGALVTSR